MRERDPIGGRVIRRLALSTHHHLADQHREEAKCNAAKEGTDGFQ